MASEWRTEVEDSIQAATGFPVTENEYTGIVPAYFERSFAARRR
ncbi:MAG TPA: hypothetical protein VHR42_06845 [Clostridia bacterium]|nr:hypothetical protein [Clostridia bacterium]